MDPSSKHLSDRGLDSSKAWNFYMACHNTLVPRWTFLGEILGGNKPVQLGTVSWGGKPAIFRLCSWCDFCIWNKKHFSCRCVECFFFGVLKFEQGVCVCVKMFLFYFRIVTPHNSNATSFQRVVAHISMCANGVHNESSLETLVFSNSPLDDIWEHITKCLFFLGDTVPTRNTCPVSQIFRRPAGVSADLARVSSKKSQSLSLQESFIIQLIEQLPSLKLA